MKWRYRYEWNLPYIEADPQEAYFFAVRQALAVYVNRSLKEDPSRVSEACTNTLEFWFGTFEHQGVFSYGEGMMPRIEGSAAVTDFNRIVRTDQHFTPTKGSDVECYTYIEDAKIVGYTDLVLLPPRGYESDAICICHITNEKSSLAQARFMPVKYGWHVAVIREHLHPKVKIYHTTFSPWHRTDLSLTKNVYQRTEFTGTVRGLIKGVESRAVWQLPTTDKCTKCCYNKICEAAHSRDLRKSEIQGLHEDMLQWKSRRASSATRKPPARYT